MKKLKMINRWFELNIGWFFVNGFKKNDWDEYLKQKYKIKNNNFPGATKL